MAGARAERFSSLGRRLAAAVLLLGAWPWSAAGAQATVELYVMSQCPVALRAEQILLPLIEARGLRWELYFIAAQREEPAGAVEAPATTLADPAPPGGCDAVERRGGGRFASLHGPGEVEEDLRQAVIAARYPGALSAYLLARAEDQPEADWRPAARGAGLDPAALERLVQGPAGAELLARNLESAAQLQVTSSPTVFFNQRIYRGSAQILELARELCRGAECAALPACARDADCEADGRPARCHSPLSPKARCELGAELDWTMVVIDANLCPSCRWEPLLEQLGGWFPGAQVERVAFPGAAAEALIARYGLTQLPALLLDRKVERELHFDRVRANLVELEDRFLLDPRLNNVSQLLGRERRAGRFELFADSRTEAGRRAELETLNYLEAHGLGGSYLRHPIVQVERAAGAARIISPYGEEDLRESARRYCVEQAVPQRSAGYARCRLEQPQRSWQQCLGAAEAALEVRVAACAAGAAARAYLEREAELREQLGVIQTPSYLIDDRILVRGLEARHAFALYEGLQRPKPIAAAER